MVLKIRGFVRFGIVGKLTILKEGYDKRAIVRGNQEPGRQPESQLELDHQVQERSFLARIVMVLYVDLWPYQETIC